ncbi:amino acid adenylation domain-containing protein [Streptomyces cinnabarinus]|uniref:Amino acid adenylation domain-containing protein n=1 Tax=Streptomyces cinnabarinus TaxID=67287 RepID=A0ABY7KTI3_9ACTN|nr:amino acid adenylation domain-containing protein [Streptomyces cinnabarinus]WAZ26179.1 amino acid adenylation domain-containing protein [Streptomyces cinnabarinus]
MTDDLDARLAALSPEQRARFDELMARREAAEDTFPLSVLQRGTWFLEQLRPHNPGYIVPGAVRAEGHLDAGVLRAAVTEIVRRHEALRTTFRVDDGTPVQVVHPEPTVDFQETDLRGDDRTAADRQRHLDEALTEPLDITTGPLLRVRLLRTGPAESVLVTATHHLISDRWSTAVFLTELTELYEAFAAGRPSPLPELEIQYGDFADWQHRQLADGAWEEDLAYWLDHLDGAPTALDLPTDRPRPAVQGFDGSFVPVELTPALMRELGALAGRHGATPYMALLAVLQILLHRHSGQDDLVVAVPVAQRDRAEVEPLIGYFVNTMAIRTDLGANPAFTTVLTRVRDACLGAYAHQGVPFELVVAALKRPRDLSRPPLAQISFSYGREPVPPRPLGGARVTRLPVNSQGARFDLELQAFDTDGGLTGWFEYDRDLFDEATVGRLAARFRRLAEQAAARPDTTVDDFELLDEAERQLVLGEWNATEHDWGAAGWVHQGFEEQVRRHPDAVAVRYDGRSLTYDALNRRANRLAHLLRDHGVGPNAVVGVAVERSLELVVCLLAVLKAGGAYTPLDLDLPPARLAAIAEDARPPVVLTHGPALDRLPPLDCPVLDVDGLATELAARPDHDPGVVLDGEDLAYVIFTSGSTGRPKGVMNVHAALRNRLLWMQDTYRLDASDRVLQKTPFSFDVSVWEFFWPLMTGATLVVARPGGHRDSGYLARIIQDEDITTLHFVPSMLQVFLTEPVEKCTGLRRVICSGEELTRDLHDRFLARSEAELHNLYGPTEAAIDVTSWHCRPDATDRRPVPIGHPITNTRLHVLDRRLRPVPVGVPGELHIGGRGLARGYLGRPDLTAERFIDDPFLPGERLYRTGDLVRHRADGALEFLGRLDHQIKLRGLRVELGEIEAVLTTHESVREAVVVAREHAPGDVRLAAYVTPASDTAPAAGDLAAHLRLRLPEYMVPASFTALERLPLTPSGKTDRKALPEPPSTRPDLQARFVAPRDEREQALAELWRSLLGVERVGLHDNFFDLGGHSLLLAEFRTVLAASLGHELTMVELFQHPTVGSLAEYLGRTPTAGDSPAHGGRERAENRRQSRNRRQRAAERRALSREDR